MSNYKTKLDAYKQLNESFNIFQGIENEIVHVENFKRAESDLYIKIFYILISKVIEYYYLIIHIKKIQ